MFKKREVYTKAALLLALVLLGTVLFSIAASAQLACSYKNTPCTASETKILGMYNYTNAHAELPSQTNYDWNVCCQVQGSSPPTLTTSCLGADTNVTGLNSSDGTGITGSHLEANGYAGIPSPSAVCLKATPGSVLCQTWNASCSADEACLFTQSNVTNAHGGDCGQNTGTDTYGWRTCCQFFPEECGAEGQQCCDGLCQPSLACIDDTCVPSPAPCPNGVPDLGETCQNCPQDIGSCPGQVSNSTVYGYVTNISGLPVAGAKVEALAKNSTTADSSGYYQLAIRNSGDDSPYDIVASYSGYESQTFTGLSVPDYVSIRQDFTLTLYRGNCNDDCTTTGSSLCSADCQGKGLCWFSSPETMSACDGTFGWTELPGGRYVNCCKGEPLSAIKASVSIPCASSVAKSEKIVLYRGKLVTMNILTFKSTC